MVHQVTGLLKILDIFSIKCLFHEGCKQVGALNSGSRDLLKGRRSQCWLKFKSYLKELESINWIDHVQVALLNREGAVVSV